MAQRLTSGIGRSARGFGPLADPFEESVVPKQAVLRLENPMDHVAAIRTAGGGHAVGIDVGQGSDMIDNGHEVVVYLAAPILLDLFGEFLPIAKRTAGIRHNYDVARGGEHLGVPAIGPA